MKYVITAFLSLSFFIAVSPGRALCDPEEKEIRTVLGGINRELRQLRVDVDVLRGAKDLGANDIEYLVELVKAAESIHKRTIALMIGSVTGDPREPVGIEALVRYELFVAKARLAAAKGRLDASEEYHVAAVSAAEGAVKAHQMMFDDGGVRLELLLDSYRNRATGKIQLSRPERVNNFETTTYRI